MTSLRRSRFRVNPFYVLFVLYSVANLVALVTLAAGSPLTVETRELIFDSKTVVMAASALFLSLLGILAIYKLCSTFSSPRGELTFGSTASLVLFIVQLSYLWFSVYYGVNIAGIEDDAGDNPGVKLIFSVVQPDQLFLILSVGIRSARLFWINALLYGLSSALRGWMGSLYLLALIVLIRKSPLTVDRRVLIRVTLLLAIGAIALPVIVSAKWFIRSGASFSDALDFLSEFGYYNYFVSSIAYVVNRFQHLGHVAMLAEDSRHLSAAYNVGAFIPFWMDGAPQWLYLRITGQEIYQLQRYIPSYYFDVDNLAYTVNPGIAGWFFVLREETILFVTYIVTIITIPLQFVLRFAGYKYFLFVSCFVLIYLFHGWIGAYVNMIIYLLTFLFAKRAFVVTRTRWPKAGESSA